MNLWVPPGWLEAMAIGALRGSLVAVGLSLGLGGARWLSGCRWRAEWTYYLAWLGLARLLWPADLPSRWSLWNYFPRGKEEVTWAVEPVPTPALESLVESVAPTDAPPTEMGITAVTPAWLPPGQMWAWVWLVGVIITVVWLLGRQWAFSRRMRHAVPWGSIRKGLIDECRMASRLRRPVAVMVADGLTSPVVCGFWRPRIIFPRRTLADLTPDDLRHVLLHEMAHIRAGDVLAGAIIAAVQALHWFNPAAHWLSRQTLSSREVLRDQSALDCLPATSESRAAYGRTLLKLAISPLPDHPTGSLAVPLFTRTKELHHRIAMIAQPLKSQRLRPWQATTAATLLILTAAPVFTTAQDRIAPIEVSVLSPEKSASTPSGVLQELEQLARVLHETKQPELAQRLEKALNSLQLKTTSSVDLDEGVGDATTTQTPSGAVHVQPIESAALVTAGESPILRQEIDSLRQQVANLARLMSAGNERNALARRNAQLVLARRNAELANSGMGVNHPERLVLQEQIAEMDRAQDELAAQQALAAEKAEAEQKEMMERQLAVQQHLASLRSALVDVQFQITGGGDPSAKVAARREEADLQKQIIRAEADLQALRLRSANQLPPR